jgi:uncharacterized peroxidase-related enzyme
VAFLRAETGDPQLAEQIKTDYKAASLDPPTRALLDYAVKVTKAPWTCTRADVEHLRALGLTDEQILDGVQVTALFNLSNRVAEALGIEVNPGYANLGVKSEAM